MEEIELPLFPIPNLTRHAAPAPASLVSKHVCVFVAIPCAIRQIGVSRMQMFFLPFPSSSSVKISSFFGLLFLQGVSTCVCAIITALFSATLTPLLFPLIYGSQKLHPEKKEGGRRRKKGEREGYRVAAAAAAVY